MPKFRKKPVVVEAVQWTGANTDEVRAFVNGRMDEITDSDIVGGRGLVIPTLEGNMIATPRDFIIRGVQGEFYPCKPDIFEATYDAA
jgi:hypothetical protein